MVSKVFQKFIDKLLIKCNNKYYTAFINLSNILRVLEIVTN